MAWALSLHFAWQASMKHELAADEFEGARPQGGPRVAPGRLFLGEHYLRGFISGAEWGKERTPAL